MLFDVLIPPEGTLRLSFQINGFTYLVPSDRMLNEAQAGMPDWVSKYRFLEESNRCVYDIEQIFNGSMSQELAIIRVLCIETGYEYNSFLRYWTIALYCNRLFGNKIVSARKNYNECLESINRLPEFLETGNIQHRSKKFWPIKWVDGLPQPPAEWEVLFSRFTEYRIAREGLSGFWNTVMRLAPHDPFIASLVTRLEKKQLQGCLRLVKQSEGEIEGSMYSFQCKYCGKVSEFTRKRGQKKRPAHCGSEECQKEYQKNKPSEKARKSTPEGWVKVHSRKPCQGDCGREQVSLNSGFLCRKCFSESLSQ
jgi:hypothetical protein